MPTERSPRRAPKAEERGKAAEQTRKRILQAAVEEFGAKGYSGARTAGIAARAGVNQQLISYHFGGKEGLLNELRRQWAAADAERVPEDATFAQSLSAYFDATLDRPEWSRLVIWQALGDTPDSEDETRERTQRRRVGMQEAVERVRRRQRDGEIVDDLDPEFVLLLSYLLAFAPIALPQHVHGILGVDPLSSEYRHRVQEQLLRIVAPHSRG
ncbi:MAG TPA: TetR family transcriptional regulator [Actinokineospora sp.]|nr:TetR family transcriptional regulator [Actinokineospora sp.]